MKYEWKKAEKQVYQVKQAASLVDVPQQSFILLEGQGDPNQPDFADKVSALFSLAYAIKMNYKKGAQREAIHDFTVYPLEGLWRQKEHGDLIKEELIYTIMIAQPNFITADMVAQALEQVKQKKPNPHYQAIRFEQMTEGKCVTILHVGSFDDEPESFAKMSAFCQEQGLSRKSLVHREIYLNNLNRTAPGKLKTILRYQVI